MKMQWIDMGKLSVH